MFSSDIVNPHTALHIVGTIPLPPVRTQQIVPAQDTTALLDLHIGLHLLGQEGRSLLAQYLRAKSQQGV